MTAFEKHKMNDLKEIKRPPLALINLVEAIGILLRVPKSMNKSKYKASVPSNYDATIELLSSDFYGTMNKMTILQSSGIPNDIATELYAKTKEPAFDYESALIAGGLAIRELFNTLVLILDQLQNDTFRMPVKTTNIFVVVDGSRSSYVALDAATHLLNHGVCNIAAVAVKEIDGKDLLDTHICQDLERRCLEQYKITDRFFRVEHMVPENTEDMITKIQESLNRNSCNVIVVGIDGQSSCGCIEFMSDFITWVAWECKSTAILVKSFSRVRPFPQSHMSRKFLVCVKEVSDLRSVFSSALEIMRPDDEVILLSIVPTRDPVGEAQETRFGMGSRFGWVSGEVMAETGASRPGWNDNIVATLTKEMEQMLQKSQSPGRVRVETLNPIRTVYEELVHWSLEEGVDFLVVRRGKTSVTKGCLQHARCTVVFTA